MEGEFTEAQRLDRIRERIALAEDHTSPNAMVILKSACIFVYEYPDVALKKDVQQIGVGIIEKIHGDPSSPEATFDIRFCPPKGARPAQGVFGNKNYRADTL